MQFNLPADDLNRVHPGSGPPILGAQNFGLPCEHSRRVLPRQPI